MLLLRFPVIKLTNNRSHRGVVHGGKQERKSQLYSDSGKEMLVGLGGAEKVAIGSTWNDGRI